MLWNIVCFYYYTVWIEKRWSVELVTIRDRQKIDFVNLVYGTRGFILSTLDRIIVNHIETNLNCTCKRRLRTVYRIVNVSISRFRKFSSFWICCSYSALETDRFRGSILLKTLAICWTISKTTAWKLDVA